MKMMTMTIVILLAIIEIVFSEDYNVLENNSDSTKMNSNNASKMDEENSSVLKRFKNNNIIKINDNIGIITNVDKKNVLIYYKVIKILI